MKELVIAICSGGTLGEWAIPYIKEANYVIGADRGAQFLIEHGIVPNISLGDFDSVSSEQVTTIQRNSKQFIGFDAIDKDYTDSQLAYMHALEQKPNKIIFVGALGSRYDHSLASIQLLELSLKYNIPSMIIDQHNTIQLMNDTLNVSRNGYRYVSLIPYSEEVTGITLHGFKYPLTDATLTKGHSIGISNELLTDQATVSIKSGKLLVIQSND
ncbi:thiamine diphosphokinase [Paenibacillus sp. FSL W7-1287]|uniref:thiamine diphosphokinase n=1 Tax=Paenibacillus sp. FSL W7-1287 TaxID=2954538 RepID=UPI0030F7D2E3